MVHSLNFESAEISDLNGIAIASYWIADLESSDSRLYKEKIIETALTSSIIGSASAQCFLLNCYYAYNPFFVFGLKQVPETEGIVNQPNRWADFFVLLSNLETRVLTGGAARAAVADLSLQFDSAEWNNVCRRVLIKDLRCGISEKTLNKVLTDTKWEIPVFSCQLATDSNKHPAKMLGRVRLEKKLDGVRVLALVSETSVVLCSRNGKVFENFPDVAATIFENRHAFIVDRQVDVVLDGEIMGKSFQELMKQAQRKSNVDTKDMVFNVFDIIPRPDFERGFWNKNQAGRTALLDVARSKLLELGNTPKLEITNGIEVDLDTAEGHDVMRRYANDAVVEGFEGIMIKKLTAPYECKRSSFWMKWKPVITVDLTIVGFEEGTGRNVGRLGALICEGTDDGRQIRVNVGTGFSDINRNEYWDSRATLLSELVEVEADAITQNQDGSYSLRFPRFARFRSLGDGIKV
jgi:DNA ligase-1